MKKTTALLSELMKTNDVKNYFEDNKDEFIRVNASANLSEIFKQKPLKKNEVVRLSGMQARYVHQIFSGTKTPSRDKFLRLCIAMAVDFDGIQRALKQSGFSQLYAKSARDSVLIYGICHRLGVSEINEMLEKNGQEPI